MSSVSRTSWRQTLSSAYSDAREGNPTSGRTILSSATPRGGLTTGARRPVQPRKATPSATSDPAEDPGTSGWGPPAPDPHPTRRCCRKQSVCPRVQGPVYARGRASSAYATGERCCRKTGSPAHLATHPPMRSRNMHNWTQAPVAQRIEQLPSKQSVGGSSPSGRTHTTIQAGQRGLRPRLGPSGRRGRNAVSQP